MEAGIKWAEDSSWIGKQIEFYTPQLGWRITGKIMERENFWTDKDLEAHKVYSQAHAVFVCTNVDDPTQETVLKTLLQYVSNPIAISGSCYQDYHD